MSTLHTSLLTHLPPCPPTTPPHTHTTHTPTQHTQPHALSHTHTHTPYTQPHTHTQSHTHTCPLPPPHTHTHITKHTPNMKWPHFPQDMFYVQYILPGSCSVGLVRLIKGTSSVSRISGSQWYPAHGIVTVNISCGKKKSVVFKKEYVKVPCTWNPVTVNIGHGKQN